MCTVAAVDSTPKDLTPAGTAVRLWVGHALRVQWDMRDLEAARDVCNAKMDSSRAPLCVTAHRVLRGRRERTDSVLTAGLAKRRIR